MKHDVASWNPAHGIRLECTCTVVLNALGYIGFKVSSLHVFCQPPRLYQLHCINIRILCSGVFFDNYPNIICYVLYKGHFNVRGKDRISLDIGEKPGYGYSFSGKATSILQQLNHVTN